MIRQVDLCGFFCIDHFQTNFLDWAFVVQRVVLCEQKYGKSMLHLATDPIEDRLDL